MESIFDWGFKALLVAGLVGNIYWIKKWMGKRESWESGHDKQHSEISTKREAWEKEHAERHINILEKFTNEGGLINREQFFDFCKACTTMENMKALMSWRAHLADQGGPLTMMEHGKTCEHIIEKTMRMVMDSFAQQEKLINEKIRAIDILLQKDRISIKTLVSEIATAVNSKKEK
jgi:hypothetical protein